MKSGFVVIIGRSNVGKSTLMNTMVGTKISATSFRAQMTRHAIHGVVNHPEGQIVFIDTPGIFKSKGSHLSSKLEKKVRDSLQGIDLIIYVCDPTREIGGEERAAYGMIRHLDIPKLLVVNKSDLPEPERKFQDDYLAWAKTFNAVFGVSALRGSHVKPLIDKIVELLPEGEELYPQDQLTNVDREFWIAEIIREKIYSVLEKEVPYSVNVEVDEIEVKKDITVVKARILTNEERYKKMIIGTRGHKIKEIGQMARRELEAAGTEHMFLELTVEVDPHWVERI